MKAIFCGLSLSAVLLAGCVDFAGSTARNQTVKALPPEIDPSLPEEPPAEQQPTRRDGDAAAEHADRRRGVRPRLTLPVTAEQITADNAYDAVEALQQEIDRDETERR